MPSSHGDGPACGHRRVVAAERSFLGAQTGGPDTFMHMCTPQPLGANTVTVTVREAAMLAVMACTRQHDHAMLVLVLPWWYWNAIRWAPP